MTIKGHFPVTIHETADANMEEVSVQTGLQMEATQKVERMETTGRTTRPTGVTLQGDPTSK